MRRSTNQPYVGFAARVPAADKQDFTSVLPMNGAKTWWTETVLKTFLDLCEADPDLQQWVHDQIYTARAEEPPRDLEEMTSEIPTELYKRFNKLFGEKGATTWLVRTVLRSYLNRAAGRPTPEQVVRESVREALGLEAVEL